MTKLRLLAAFLILVGAGAVQAAENSVASTIPAPQAVAASQTATPAASAFVALKGEIPAPFFAAKTSCYVERECCDGSIISCSGTTCRLAINRVICDSTVISCPFCP
jgi:hypothetical protein